MGYRRRGGELGFRVKTVILRNRIVKHFLLYFIEGYCERLGFKIKNCHIKAKFRRSSKSSAPKLEEEKKMENEI